jgi:hypothetical protein
MDGAMDTLRLAVPDAEVARLVARDLEDALDRWGQEHPGPFYAATLWVDEVYGYVAFNTADQTDYEERCARYAGFTEQELHGPAFHVGVAWRGATLPPGPTPCSAPSRWPTRVSRVPSSR